MSLRVLGVWGTTDIIKNRTEIEDLAMPGKRIDWPMIHEYDEALLDRHRSFRDPDIQNGILAEIHPGLPMHLNGGGCQYICVYRVGNWVVRCFVSDPPAKIEPPEDILPRYEHITDYIKQRQKNGHLKFLAPCELIDSGVNIKGKYFPYLKIPYMANSRSLGDFLSDHYQDRQTVALLAQQWLKLIQEMEDHRIAHGDLDLSNVLVYGGRMSPGLYLIDFDGMYIPDFAFTNMDMTDKGHAHFQPSQSGIRKFDSTMDRFSLLVIYLSFCALEQNPDLWVQCEASERNLLLHEEDFQRLAQSTRFPLLRKEKQNKHLQLCLDELQTSIDRKRMPRSLKETLKEAGPITMDSSYVYQQQSEAGSYSGMPLVIPIEEPLTVGAQYSSMSSSQYDSTPLADFPQYVQDDTDSGTSSASPSQAKAWIIGLVIFVIFVVILIAVSAHH
jgi:hypothetical protein